MDEDDFSYHVNTIGRDFLYFTGSFGVLGMLCLLYGLGKLVRPLTNCGMAIGTGFVAGAVFCLSYSWNASNETDDVNVNDDGLYQRRFIGMQVTSLLSIGFCSLSILVQIAEFLVLRLWSKPYSPSHKNYKQIFRFPTQTYHYCMESWVGRSKLTRIPESLLFLGIGWVSISFGVFFYENDMNMSENNQNDENALILAIRIYYKLCFAAGAIDFLFVLILMGKRAIPLFHEDELDLLRDQNGNEETKYPESRTNGYQDPLLKSYKNSQQSKKPKKENNKKAKKDFVVLQHVNNPL